MYKKLNTLNDNTRRLAVYPSNGDWSLNQSKKKLNLFCLGILAQSDRIFMDFCETEITICGQLLRNPGVHWNKVETNISSVLIIPYLIYTV